MEQMPRIVRESVWKWKILYVEDDLSLIEGLKYTLEKNGFQVDGAGQLYKMIAAEAVTYAVLGCVTGCVLGLPLNKMM